jgi:hypothetical protein
MQTIWLLKCASYASQASQIATFRDSEYMSDYFVLIKSTAHSALDIVQDQLLGCNDATLVRKCVLRSCAPNNLPHTTPYFKLEL